MQAKIVLSDGTQIQAEKSADCYITPAKPEFPEELGRVVITANGDRIIFEDALLIECAAIDDRYWFAFMEMPEDMKLRRRISELESTNGMLEECILEMSEIIYA